MTITVQQILQKAADNCGFKRVKYIENNIPTTMSNVTILFYFGDLKSILPVSSLLMERFRKESKSSKYFILCSWNGNQSLFPYVDEYWEISDLNNLKSIYLSSVNQNNTSEALSGYKRALNNYFPEILDISVLNNCYNNGFKQEFFDNYKNIKKFLPSIPSSSILGNDFNKKMSEHPNKIFIHPTTHIQEWKNGRYHFEYISELFWSSLIDKLISENITPVIYQDFKTYDLSLNYFDKCIFIKNNDILNILSAIRSCGMVLDIFNGISRLAIIARCPYILCSDRFSYNYIKQYEVDILCGNDIPRDNLYTFSSICNDLNKNNWNASLFEAIVSKIKLLDKDLIKDNLPSPIEINEIVKYELARKAKVKKFGPRFVKIKNIN